MTNESERQVEAALFIAGKPITVKEIEDSQGLDPRTVRLALGKLIKKYASEDTAIEVLQFGSKYAMQVKDKYTKKLERLEAPEIPKEAQKVAALIACYQPILQSKLSAMVGPFVYDGVKILSDRGLINVKPKGRSFELTTTQEFIEYFGIDASTRAEVKHWFENKLRGAPSKD